MKRFLRRAWDFFRTGIWQISTQSVRPAFRLPFRWLKLGLLSVRGFTADRAGLRAAALTLYSLLSIVPVLAVGFGIAKGFGLESRLESWLFSQFPDQQEIVTRTVAFARRALEGTEGGLIAGAGVVFLLYSVVMVTGNIERAINHIWCVTKPRRLRRRAADYLSLILIGPFVILGTSSLNLFLQGWVHRAAGAGPFATVIGPATSLALRIVPFLLLGILFSFTYLFLPNASVKPGSALVGGAVAATLYQLLQSCYIETQVGVSRNNAIYGSFAALPLFIVWLQLSWQIVLFGAEVTYHHQHFRSNELAERVPRLSFRAIKRLALGLATEAIGRFIRGEPAPSEAVLGEALHVPSQVVGDLVDRLVNAGVLTKTVGSEEAPAGFVPARDPALLPPGAILDAIERDGEDLDERDEDSLAVSSRALAAMDRCFQEEGELATASWHEPLAGSTPEPRIPRTGHGQHGARARQRQSRPDR